MTEVKRKGFTLVELIGVIAVLGIITLLIVPVVDKTLKDNREKLYNTQIENIISGLRTWAVNNMDTLPETNGQKITVTLEQLKQGGYVDQDIKNAKTKEQFPNTMKLKITNWNGSYLYEVE